MQTFCYQWISDNKIHNAKNKFMRRISDSHIIENGSMDCRVLLVFVCGCVYKTTRSKSACDYITHVLHGE